MLPIHLISHPLRTRSGTTLGRLMESEESTTSATLSQPLAPCVASTSLHAAPLVAVATRVAAVRARCNETNIVAIASGVAV
jgi:hypothetical protein